MGELLLTQSDSSLEHFIFTLPFSFSKESILKILSQCISSISSQATSEIFSSVSLKVTIVDDAKTLLETCSGDSSFRLTFQEKANALACISILSEIDDTAALKLYLDYHKTALQRSQCAVNELENLPEISFPTLSSILTETVRILQSALLDVYILFLKKFPTFRSDESDSFCGLLSRSKYLLLQRVLRALTGSTHDKDSPMGENTPRNDEVIILKETLNVWMHEAFLLAHTICEGVLRLLHSASEVARLQQIVWSRCSSAESFSSQLEAVPDIQMVEDSQFCWEEASKDLFSNFRRRRGSFFLPVASSSGEEVNGASLLWTSVFSLSFVKQVCIYCLDTYFSNE